MLSKSSHLLRLSGIGSAEEDDAIQAEDCDFKSGIEFENCIEGGLNIGFIENGDYIGFKDIDLTDAKDIDFRVSSNGAQSAIEVRLDSPDGKLIGSMDVNGTGDWQNWSTQTCAIEETSGKHNVYLVFTGEEGYLFNINWWKPNTPAAAVIIGDLNGDKVVDIYDLTQMRNAAMENDAEYFTAADINGDDAIDGEDLILLKKFIMGEIKTFD